MSRSPRSRPYYANGFLNGLLGGDGFDLFTLVIFAIGIIGFAYSQWRTRQARIHYNQTVEAMWLFVLKIVLIAAIVMWFGNQLAHSRGLPIVLILLAVLVLIYGVLADRHYLRTRRLRHRRQQDRHPVRYINVKMVSFWVYVNMGFPGRGRRRRLLRPHERCAARGGRQHVRTGRHRRLLHPVVHRPPAASARSPVLSSVV